jgi:ubiquinone/menaquinone biosynthesis C-methylase UbiE
MPKVGPFEKYWEKYEVWFEDNRFVYESELQALKELLPQTSRSIEIGVGSGRFAFPLGINLGIDPSPRMRELARKRGIKAISGVAEAIPFRDSSFELVLMVTTLCFLDDIGKALEEIYRILRRGGTFLIGLFDKDSPMGKSFLKEKDGSLFFREAKFYSAGEIFPLLTKIGFRELDCRQTLFRPLSEIEEVEPIKKGYGQGLFVALKANR